MEYIKNIRFYKYFILNIIFIKILIGSIEIASADIYDTKNEEIICKEIGFKTKTEGFGSCVLNLVERSRSTRSVKDSNPQLTAHEQTCVSYGFQKRTSYFSACLLELDRVKQQAQLVQQQYDLQLAQYQQQIAAYEAQQKALKRERERRKWEAIGRLGAGIASSNSPTLLGAMNDGFAAANNVPSNPVMPTPPLAPALQNYTVRMPNGNQVYCNYNSISGYVSCR